MNHFDLGIKFQFVAKNSKMTTPIFECGDRGKNYEIFNFNKYMHVGCLNIGF